MEELNKKNLYQIFLGFLFFQVFALLALSANFLLAETTNPVFNITVSTENNATDISGNANFYAVSVSPDGAVFKNLGFYFINQSDSSYYGFTGTPTDSAKTNWTVNVDTKYWSDGSYYYYAKGYYGDYTYETTPYISDNHIIINVNNSLTTILPLTMQFVNIPSMPFLGNTTLYVETSEIADSVQFKVKPNSGSYTTYYGTSGSNNQNYFVWPTINFANDSYTVEAIANKSGYETAYAYIYGATVNNTTTITPLAISFYENYSVSAVSGTKTIYTVPNNTVDKVDFQVISSVGTTVFYTGTKDATLNKYFFAWNTASFANGAYTLKAIANSGIETAEAQSTVTVYNSTSIISTTPATTSTTTPITTPTITPTFTISVGIDGVTVSGQIISGTKNMWAKSVSSDSTSILNNLNFMLKKTSDNSYIHIATATTTDYKNWSGTWNSVNIADGNYDFFAEGKYKKTDGTYVTAKSSPININIKNSATNALVINFYEDYSVTAISGVKMIYTLPNKEVSSVKFKVTSSAGVITSYTGTKEVSSNKYYFYWNTPIFTDGIYMLEATACGISTTETASAAPIKITIYNSANVISLNAEFVNVPSMPLAGDKKIQIKTNLEPASVKFEVKGVKYMSFPAIKIDANNYYFLWKTNEFPNGDYLIYAFVEKGTEKIDRYAKTSISNSTTTTTTIPTIPMAVTFIEKFIPPLSGDQKISISADQEIYSCVFKIEGPKFAEITGVKDSSTQCHILLRTSNFPNGDYVIRAIAGKDSLFGENKLSTRIENQISSAIEPISAEPASTTEPMFIDANFMPQECRDRGLLTAEECQKYFGLPYECRINNILDPIKCKEYLFKQAMPQECLNQNAQTQEECEKIIMLKNMPLECQRQGAVSKEECDKIMQLKSFLTPECGNADITSVESCNEYMADNFMPEECRLENITTKEDCDYLLRNKCSNLTSLIKDNYSMGSEYFPDECKEENAEDEQECEEIMFRKYAPKECVEAQALSSEKCEKLMFEKYAPDDCRKAGVINPEACKKYMFEKYGNKENIPQEKFPIECQKAKVKTADECEKVMKKMYMPKECAENGISDEKECDLYFKQKYMPKECQEKNAGSREECDKIMFKKFGPPECEKAGIEDENECEKFISNKYAEKIKCEGLEQWQCKNTIEERHIGNIVATQSKFEEIREKTADLIGKTINLEDLKIETAGERGISPLKEKIGLKIVAAREKLVLDEEENLIQTSPVALMMDSDEDELPDDTEKRIGTDPFSKDTDGDGYSDSEEIRSGHNPSGEGKLEKEISSIDEAILQNKIIEHPKTEGEETESFTVENINNIKNDQDGISEGYLLNGKAEPNSVATIYIYSDLPVVMTVDVDQYGNWLYKLDQSLVEGEHEIYVAVNDNTGKVVKKSKPLNFFVKEASAISVKDFISEASASSEEPGESETSIYNYLLIAIAMAFFGALLFLAVIISRKKNQPLS